MPLRRAPGLVRLALAALALLAAWIALPGDADAAATWRTESGSESAGGALAYINRGERLYLYTNDAGPTTVVLDVSRCTGGIDLYHDSDTASASANPSNTAALAWCPTATYSASTCGDLAFDADGGGLDTNVMTGESLAGKAVLWAVRTRYLAVTLTVAASAVQMTGDCR